MSQFAPRHARPARKGRSSRRNTRNLILRSGLIGMMVACGLTAALPADAQAPPAAPTDNEQPVLLSADTVTFDEEKAHVTASGNVELSQGARTVRADTITYNRRTKVVTATGNIRLVEPGGDIVFADYAELTDDMRDAFVDNIRLLMTDNSRMAGNEGERRDGKITRLNRAVYSPCELCPTDPTRPPLWQVRAVRVVHDSQEKEVRYKDAVLEMFGVPIAYTPYLSHPDPTVDRKSGFLSPTFGSNSELGLFLRPSYYIDIDPNQDATVEVGAYSKQGFSLGGQYRRRFERGSLVLDGSVAQGEIPKAGGVDNRDRRLRGHIAARGLFEIDDVWRWGFDASRASDYTYLRRYYGMREDFLTSRAFVEGFQGRSYAGLNAFSFQDLRRGNPVEEPVVLPMATWNALGEPGSLFGGRWSLDAGVLALHRRDGTNTRRFTVAPGWRREITSNVGFVTTIDASVLAAAYQATDYDRPDRPGIQSDTANRFRLFPQGQVMVRYPFVRYGESSSQLIEPLVALTAAPRISNSPEVPNEDSRDIEFDETNLFMPSRFTGVDRLEGGSRVTYGLRTGIYGYTVGSASLFLGQSYRFTENSDFPEGSGLRERASDYVGRLDLSPASWLDVNYGFRVDQESLRPRRHSLTASGGVPEFRLSTNYTYVDQTTDRYASRRSELEQVGVAIGSQFHPNWSVSLAHQQAMAPDPGPRSSAAVLTYQDECFTFQAIARRDFTESVLDDEPDGNTIFFRLVFKNLGEVTTPGISTSIIGPGGS